MQLDPASQPGKPSSKSATDSAYPSSADTGKSSQGDRKYNVVIFGVPESKKGLNKMLRQREDWDNVSRTFDEIGSDVSAQSIRDCFRLGKYVEGSRTRPILVKLNRTADVSNVLSRSVSPGSAVSIKPDLSREDRVQRALLLKARWELIQSGIDKRDVRIRNASILVKGALYGKVEGSCFKKCVCPTNSNTSDGCPAGPSNDTSTSEPTPRNDDLLSRSLDIPSSFSSESPQSSPLMANDVNESPQSSPLTANDVNPSTHPTISAPLNCDVNVSD